MAELESPPKLATRGEAAQWALAGIRSLPDGAIGISASIWAYAESAGGGWGWRVAWTQEKGTMPRPSGLHDERADAERRLLDALLSGDERKRVAAE